MQRVREVMENNAAGNTAQVNTMLETMLTGFMAKLEDTFGGQINGINEQMQRSMAAMGTVQTSLQALVQDIQKANENAATQMSDKLAAAMQSASDNQQQLTQQMTQFVTDFRSLVAEEQRKSKDAMNETIAGLLSEVGK
jgi:adenylosuccinate synthase